MAHAKEYLEQSQALKPDNSYVFRTWACYYAVKNENEKAIDNLNTAAKMDFDQSEWVAREKTLDAIRRHPKFQAIMDRIEKNKVKY